MDTERGELMMPGEDEDHWIDAERFAEKWYYSLRSDFTSPSGVPATWAPHHPQHWGQEHTRIPLNGAASATAISHDDKFLAVGIERDIHIFSLTTHERVDVLKGHPGNIVFLQFPQGFDSSHKNRCQYLLASQGDEEEEGEINTLIMWELDDEGRELYSKDTSTELVNGKIRFEGHLGLPGNPIFSPDLKTMVYVVSNVTADVRGFCQYSPSIHLWDIETRSLRYQLPGHTHIISWIGISSNNLFAASISYDGTARVWDINAGVSLQVIDPQGGYLLCGAFSPDSKYLAISQSDPNALLIYDITTGVSITSVEMPEIVSIAWSPDSFLIAVGLGFGSLCLLDPYTGVFKMRWLLGFKEYLMQSYASIKAVQFLDGGKKLAFQVIQGTVEVYDFETNLKLQFTRDPEVKIAKCPRAEVVYSHDSKFLIVVDVDQKLRIWKL